MRKNEDTAFCKPHAVVAEETEVKAIRILRAEIMDISYKLSVLLKRYREKDSRLVPQMSVTCRQQKFNIFKIFSRFFGFLQVKLGLGMLGVMGFSILQNHRRHR